MNINEVKKALYKEKPTATLIGKSRRGDTPSVTYKARLESGQKVLFRIPMTESVGLRQKEPAQLLIRWLDYKKDIKEIDVKDAETL